ncbi:MAG: hypothetical protein IPK59_10475 [Rhodospirillaceae bacterium]|nr:hypothetical protein [Rhodospirillaceae bacterium]
MTRQPLPARRQSRTRTLTWKDDNLIHVFELTVGFNDRGEVREIFANSPKIRNQVKAQIDDALVVFSRALQFGDSIAEIAASLGREGIDADSPAASIYGLMARAAVEIETEEGPTVAVPTSAPASGETTSPLAGAYLVLQAAHEALLDIVNPLLSMDEADIAGIYHENQAVYDTIKSLQRSVIPLQSGETISDASARHALRLAQQKEA